MKLLMMMLAAVAVAVCIPCLLFAETTGSLPYTTPVVMATGETNVAALISAAAVTEKIAGITNVMIVEESDPVAYPVATNALTIAQAALTEESDTLATVTARGGTTTHAVTFGIGGGGAIGESSFRQGFSVDASGDYSHAEGASTTASGYYSHAEGEFTTASGYSSHAEGASTTASGYYSHAEGESTTASGNYSHAEGVSTTASGYSSHASGYKSVSSKDTAFVLQGSEVEYYETPYG